MLNEGMGLLLRGGASVANPCFVGIKKNKKTHIFQQTVAAQYLLYANAAVTEIAFRVK